MSPGPDPAWFPLAIAPAGTLDLGAIESALGAAPAGLQPGNDGNGDDGFLYLDCGAWVGDGKSAAAQRSFALVCGRTAVLCEFAGTRPVQLPRDGPADELEPLHKLLLTLAGPMRLDVTVQASLRSPASQSLPEPAGHGERPVYLLLPDLRLPLVPRLPDVDPDLVPDPNKATCACHGPVVSRMLYGTEEAPSRYRVVGAPLSRNPNDWFYWMAESYKAVANDLIKLLDRLSKHPAAAPVHLIQLGRLCEVWTGYRCVLQSMGRGAFVQPTIAADQDPEALLAEWSAVTIATKPRDAVMRLADLPRPRRTLLDAVQCPSFEAPGVLFAETVPEPPPGSVNELPLAFLALREQKVQLRPWRCAAPPGFRIPMLARLLRRFEARPFPIYAAAGTQRPCLVNVSYPRRLLASHARYVAVA